MPEFNTEGKPEKINELIQSRKAVYPHDFIDKEIPKEIIEQVLRNADRAPTHKLTQPWRFRVLGKEKRAELGLFLANKYKALFEGSEKYKAKKFESFQKKTNQSACIIAIHMQRDRDERVPEWEETAAVAMAVQNMWLTCTAYGIGAYWSSPGLIKYMDEFYKMQVGEKCLGFFFMGYFERDTPFTKRTDLDQKVRWYD